MAVLFLAGTCELRSWSAQRERGGGGGSNGEWAWAYSGRTYHNPLNHFNSSASTSPCWHALVSFLQQVVSGVKLFLILFSVLENIWQRRRWNLFICYSVFQLVRVGLNFFDKLNFPFEWNWQVSALSQPFWQAFDKDLRLASPFRFQQSKRERRGLQAPAQTVAKNTRCAWESM